MNLKADRIESILQVLNRNLSLICVGQIAGISPIESRSLRRIDTSVFSSDKFAFEMIEFAKSYRKPATMDLQADWERHFVKGLELLLAECAVVKDEVERDCFVSRIYAWFMEKLIERRDLDTDKAEASGKKKPLSIVKEDNQDNSVDLLAEEFPAPAVDGKTQLYSKHAYPAVKGQRPPGKDAEQEDNLGKIFLKEPQTEAEIEMHNLWLAKRQQEAFDDKARHQLAVVMDRRSLLKSRLESEALRRLESSTFLAASFDSRNSPGKSPTRPISAGNSRYAPIVKRPMSGKRQYMSALENGYDELETQQKEKLARDKKKAQPEAMDDLSLEELAATREEGAQTSIVTPIVGEGSASVRIKKANGTEENTSIPRSSRSVVEKPKPAFQPMRFKTNLPEGFVAKQKKLKAVTLENYLQDYNSDDDEVETPSRQVQFRTGPVDTAPVTVAPTTKTIQKSKSMPVGSAIAAVLSKRDPIRDRPRSAQKFREMSATDSEMKVLYRHSNFRRMPLTEAQEKWLNDREDKRISSAKESIKKIAEENASKTKKGDKKGSKGKPTPKKDGKKTRAPEIAIQTPKVVKKYSSASDFMDTHFPNFDNDDNFEAQGPMRAEQLLECERCFECLSELNVPMDVIRRALLIPQDRPEAICLENTKDPIEGLMVNPLPKEYWRVLVKIAKKKKKQKGKGGKKKK